MTELNADDAAELLRSARAGDRSAYRIALERCTPALRGYATGLAMRGELGRMTRDVGASADDVAATALLKLTARWPSRNDGNRPVATVLAWTKTVVTNELKDRWRKMNVRAEQSLETLETRPSVRLPPSQDPDPERIVEARQELRSVKGMLRECYPAGLEVAERNAEAALADDELAAQLGISVDNLQKRRSRSGHYARAYRCLSETPAARDEVVARAMSAALNPNTREIIARVRTYVRREQRRGGGAC